MTEERIRITLRDRLLRGDPVVGVLGPLAVPSRDAVVRAIRRIAAAGPHTRVALGFDPDSRHWIMDPGRLDEWCDEIVVSIPAPTEDEAVAVANRQAWLLDADHPLRIVLAGDYVIQVNDHALGDGVLFVDRLAAIIALASGTTDLPRWLGELPAPQPLGRAVRHTLMRRGAFRSLAAERRTDRILARASAQDTSGVGIQHEWRPELAVVASRISVSRMGELKSAVRDSGATLSAALIVLLRRALLDEDVPLRRDPMVIYNLRRYLPDGESVVGGNFVSGLPVRSSDPSDPIAVGRAMRAQIESARPLAALVVGVVKASLVGVPGRLWRTVSDRPAAHLVFNNLGRAEPFDALPWAAVPDQRTCGIITRPGGPEDVTILLAMVAGVLHVTASFHSNVLDETSVTNALERFCRNPGAMFAAIAAQSPRVDQS